MDGKKSKKMEKKPASMETPEIQPKTQNQLSDIETQQMPAQEIPATEQNVPVEQPMDYISSPDWHPQIIIEQQDEASMPITYETTSNVIPMYEVNMEADMDLNKPRYMRGFSEDQYNFGYNQYDYRVYDDVDDMLDKIMRYNPGVFRRLAAYGVPFPEARNMVRKIIRLTLNQNR